MSRKIRDELLKVVTALPAAAANNNSAAIDLEQASAFPVNEGFDVELDIPATPALVEDKTVIYTFEDSADGTTFAAIPELSTVTITGAAAEAGGPAATRVVRLPSSTRRYIRNNAAVLADGGNNTGVSRTMSLLL